VAILENARGRLRGARRPVPGRQPRPTSRRIGMPTTMVTWRRPCRGVHRGRGRGHPPRLGARARGQSPRRARAPARRPDPRGGRRPRVRDPRRRQSRWRPRPDPPHARAPEAELRRRERDDVSTVSWPACRSPVPRAEVLDGPRIGVPELTGRAGPSRRRGRTPRGRPNCWRSDALAATALAGGFALLFALGLGRPAARLPPIDRGSSTRRAQRRRRRARRALGHHTGATPWLIRSRDGRRGTPGARASRWCPARSGRPGPGRGTRSSPTAGRRASAPRS